MEVEEVEFEGAVVRLRWCSLGLRVKVEVEGL